ncbi:amidase [Leucobacter denitrificans]|uniref:Amidase n=1 Tax=Leucobacter denitrificans TaxID=683042 RepID=A0A7G9S326_9MICO|nr:amidase [Leucobacter denitrificans]QNN62251.1 amidase [Leucobacter denitrificans]
MSVLPGTSDPFDSAVALQAALHSGEITAVEATTTYLERISSREDLGAFITVTADSALEEARLADELFDAHRNDPSATPLPLILGMPTAHKDLTEVAGVPTTRGSAAFEPEIATADHPVVATLRRAGMISLGKTQVPEFGLTGYSENNIAPPARNPHDLARTPGGSSGGSAAAVAAGLLPVAPGSDGGGSIRIPSLACGLVGLKTGLGTIAGDIESGAADPFGGPKLSVHGPIARTAADAALLMDALAPGGHYREAVARAGDLTGITVARCEASPFDAVFDIKLSPDARLAYNTAASRLAALGHLVDEADYTYDPTYPEIFTNGWTSGLSLLEIEDSAVDHLMPLTRAFRERALGRSAEEHRANATLLNQFAAEVRELWGRSDVVLTPGLTMDAPLIGEFLSRTPDGDYQLQCEWAPYTSVVNVSGLPAIAVPILKTSAGLPMGVQLIGRRGSEAQLLALAAQLQSFS